MIHLLILFCVTGTTDPTSCNMQVVASGFTDQRQCEVFSPLMLAGWTDLNEGYEVRRVWCVPNPEYFIGRFRA